MNLKKIIQENKLRMAGQGFELIKCSNCKGSGYIGESWEDEYGRYNREKCQYCFLGSIKVKIDPARQKLAMLELMRRLE